MDLSSLSCCFTTPAHLVLLWASAAIEQGAASPDSNFSLNKSMRYNLDPCEQYFQDGQDLCATTRACCQTGMDEYGWIAAAVGWSLWFLTLILVCVNKVAKLRPDEPQKYTSA
ncbi:transmembrane protein 213-like [Pristis pectinata]|uniref:transmembrane protein 213-like n=1 Tax=Pristis pectinata TaxID=685728 RepID=UPI00223D04C8|nr:transmembrane protein 213-like [Pristis pectinata]